MVEITVIYIKHIKLVQSSKNTTQNTPDKSSNTRRRSKLQV